MQAETVITNAIITIRIFLVFALAMLFKAFLNKYIAVLPFFVMLTIDKDHLF
jgi:hypothetical protein